MLNPDLIDGKQVMSYVFDIFVVMAPFIIYNEKFS